MKSKSARIDRFISQTLSVKRRDIKGMLAQGRVQVDNDIIRDADLRIHEFSRIVVDGDVLQNRVPVHVIMNKPVGVVSATKDDQHTTVVDLMDRPDKAQLHIVGRLDLNSSGLLLLTNDGRWSRQLSLPETKVSKVYRVTLKNPLSEDYVQAFAEGMYFPYENITTRPARLKIIDEYTAEVTLVEGKYHQIKRMFGRFRNPVLALHRLSVGNLTLDETLLSGQSRNLTVSELSEL